MQSKTKQFGRPKIKESEKRTKPVSGYVTQETYDKLESYCFGLMSHSDFINVAVQEKLAKLNQTK